MGSQVYQSYDDARDSITDGMVVFFKAVTPGQKIISTCTGGSFSHCGITTWMTDSQSRHRLMILESTSGGCRLVNLSAYKGREALIMDIGVDWNSIADHSLNDAGVIHYSLFDFVMLGVKDILLRFGLKWLASKVPNTTGEVCSEFLAETLRDAGFPISDVLISPQDLFEEISSSGWVHSRMNVK